MRFAQDFYLNYLWLIILLAFFFLWAMKYQRKMLEKFVHGQMIQHLQINYNTRVYLLRNIFLVLVIVFSILALSRPQWGFEWQEVKRQGVDILLLMDISKSMLTQDLKPNRLERAKLAVQDLIKKLKGDRIGLVAFAGDAFLMCPVTIDYSGFLLSLNDLTVHSISRGGTNIERALEEALNNYQDVANKYKAIIVMTDGEELEGDALKLAKKAKQQGIKIFCIGVGTQEGELIQVRNASGELEFLKDSQGNFIKSRLNEPVLVDIAALTDGVYVRATGANFGLEEIYDREIAKFEKREIESKKEKRYHERFQYPLAAAFILLIGETILCLRPSRKIF